MVDNIIHLFNNPGQRLGLTRPVREAKVKSAPGLTALTMKPPCLGPQDPVREEYSTNLHQSCTFIMRSTNIQGNVNLDKEIVLKFI